MSDIQLRTCSFLAAFHRQCIGELEDQSLTVESFSEFQEMLAFAISKKWVTADGGLALTERGLEAITS